jgi:putative endonuclease
MTENTTWEVYIIQTKAGKLYTGITKDLNRRFKEHKTNQKGARFFHFSQPEKIVFHEICPNRSDASKREAQIKKMNKKQKLDLIQNSKKTAKYRS